MPPPDPTAPTADASGRCHFREPGLRPRRGGTVGRYCVLDRLGAGGMGVVYSAYDPALDRRVAIKVLQQSLGIAGTSGRSRLLREAQALAKLRHPNVVVVHDVGDAEGYVYVAMECIDGATLGRWLKETKPGYTDILRVFTAAGRGLAAAHSAAIVHRDFKPDNVMIERSTRDKDERVVVMDFGLAHAVGALPSGSAPPSVPQRPSALSAPLTEDGAIMGTPLYMAPEQILGRATDPRTDQYSFCLSLWEALYGDTPFAGGCACDMAEAKLSGTLTVPRDSSVPRSIRRALQRGLATQPSDRWPSMRPLLDALDVDPSNRRRIAIGGVATFGVGVALFVGIPEPEACAGASAQLAGVWDETRRQDVERAVLETGATFAASTWERLAGEFDAYGDRWIAAQTDACEATRVHGTASDAAMDARMACLTVAKRHFDAAIVTVAGGDANSLERAHQVTADLPNLDRCGDAELLRAEVAPPPSADVATVAQIEAHLSDASTALAAGDGPTADAAVKLARAGVEDVDYPPILVEVVLSEANAALARGDVDEADEAYQEARERAAAAGLWDAMRRATLGRLQSLGYHLRRFEAAAAMFDVVRGLSIGDARKEASYHEGVGDVYLAWGNGVDAEAAYRRALESGRAAYGADDSRLLAVRRGLAAAVFAAGRPREAATQAREVVAQTQRVLGAEHPEVALGQIKLASALAQLGEFEEARSVASEALALWIRAYPDGHRNIAVGHMILAGTLHAAERYPEAEVEYRRAIARFEDDHGTDHPFVAATRSNLAKVLAGLGRHEEAVAEARDALAKWLEQSPPDHSNTIDLYQDLAAVLEGAGQHEEAERYLRDAWELSPPTLPAMERGNTAYALARLRARSASGPDDARKWAEIAVAAYARAGHADKQAAAQTLLTD